MDVAYNLVDPHKTSDVATFRCLLLDMFGPVFLNALNQPKKKSTLSPARKRKRKTRQEGWGVYTGARRTHLVNASGVTETPASPRVRLTNGIARVAASALVSFTAIARATIALRALLVQFVNVVTELSDL